jgi:hypothetical protein
MNKTTTTCTTGTTLPMNKLKRKTVKQMGTMGCSYITHVNLYLHPSVNPIISDTPIVDEMPKVKTRCNSPGCFYYDCDLFGGMDDYYCCNPLCNCFRPDWYSYL